MTARTDTLVALSDIPAAIGLLTRLPVPVDGEAAQARSHRAPWAYPLAGLAVALVAGLIGQIALWVGLPPVLVAGLALTSSVIVTGALHEDGLADAADGLWGGWTRDRRLEIMKDSRIGAYGVLALILSLGLRWSALMLLIEAGALWPALIAAGMGGRAMMVPLMARLPHARSDGLSHSVGQPTLTTSRVAEVLGLCGVGLCWGVSGAIVFAIMLAVATGCAMIARAKIGGQTGDILGATGQMVEIAILITLAALVT
ncbi:MAG: adenosylcobinamide-GDP ribazoletransferase [Pseudomonadota bacterium]